MEATVPQKVWLGSCLVCGAPFYAGLEWLASRIASGGEPPTECCGCHQVDYWDAPPGSYGRKAG